MKILLLVLFLCSGISAFPGEFPHLGTLGPHTAIPLERPDAPEHAMFKVEAQSGTNILRFATTNLTLGLTNFPDFPNGRVVMGVKSLTEGGEESPAYYCTFDIRWGAPRSPRAGKILGVLHVKDGDSLTNAVRKRDEERKTPPPVPRGGPPLGEKASASMVEHFQHPTRR